MRPDSEENERQIAYRKVFQAWDAGEHAGFSTTTTCSFLALGTNNGGSELIRRHGTNPHPVSPKHEWREVTDMKKYRKPTAVGATIIDVSCVPHRIVDKSAKIAVKS